VNSLPKTVTRQPRDCNLNPGPSAPESSTLTTRLPSHPVNWDQLHQTLSEDIYKVNDALFLVVVKSSCKTECLRFTIPVCGCLHSTYLASDVVFDAPSQ